MLSQFKEFVRNNLKTIGFSSVSTVIGYVGGNLIPIYQQEMFTREGEKRAGLKGFLKVDNEAWKKLNAIRSLQIKLNEYLINSSDAQKTTPLPQLTTKEKLDICEEIVEQTDIIWIEPRLIKSREIIDVIQDLQTKMAEILLTTNSTELKEFLANYAAWDYLSTINYANAVHKFDEQYKFGKKELNLSEDGNILKALRSAEEDYKYINNQPNLSEAIKAFNIVYFRCDKLSQAIETYSQSKLQEALQDRELAEFNSKFFTLSVCAPG